METPTKTPKKRSLAQEDLDPTSSMNDSIMQKTPNDGDAATSSARKKRKISRIECIVCMNDVAKTQFPRLPHAIAGDGGHEHESQVCFKCWKEHLKSEIRSNGFQLVACPQCDKMLVEAEVRKLASSFDYNR